MHIGVQYLALKECNTGEQCGLSLDRSYKLHWNFEKKWSTNVPIKNL